MCAPGNPVSRLRGGAVQAFGGLGDRAPSRLPSIRVRRMSPRGLHLLVVRSRAAVLLEGVQCPGAASERPRRGSSLPADAAGAAPARPPSAVVPGAPAKESDASRLPKAGELCHGSVMHARAGESRATRRAGAPEEPGDRLRGLRPSLQGAHPARFPALPATATVTSGGSA